jgi:hypothetical protein
MIFRLKSVSQIHRFHLRLGYDALTACFLVISVGGHTAPLLPQFCSSSFFHAAGAPFKTPASFNCSLKFSEYRRRTVQKMHRKVVERWLYSANMIFLPLRGTNIAFVRLHCPARHPEGNRSAPDVGI